jgi:hypothetical protein
MPMGLPLMFDWSINIGHLITILVLGAGGVGFVYVLRGRVDHLSSRMLALEIETKKLIDVLIAQGRHDERLTAMDARMASQDRRLDEITDRLNRVQGQKD